MTARWPATETTAWYSERKGQWHATALTELPCKHVISGVRKHADKQTATRMAERVVADKVRRHPKHKNGK